jgi:hypothetical protein
MGTKVEEIKDVCKDCNCPCHSNYEEENKKENPMYPYELQPESQFHKVRDLFFNLHPQEQNEIISQVGEARHLEMKELESKLKYLKTLYLYGDNQL